MWNLSEVFPNFNKNDSSFKVHKMLNCPGCGDKGMIRVTDDGNKNQDCMTCGKILRRYGIKNFFNLF